MYLKYFQHYSIISQIWCPLLFSPIFVQKKKKSEFKNQKKFRIFAFWTQIELKIWRHFRNMFSLSDGFFEEFYQSNVRVLFRTTERERRTKIDLETFDTKANNAKLLKLVS